MSTTSLEVYLVPHNLTRYHQMYVSHSVWLRCTIREMSSDGLFTRGANLTQSDIVATNPSRNSVLPITTLKAKLNESRYEEELYQMYTNMPKLVILLHGCHGISHIHETLLLFTLTSAEFIQTREAQNTLYSHNTSIRQAPSLISQQEFVTVQTHI